MYIIAQVSVSCRIDTSIPTAMVVLVILSRGAPLVGSATTDRSIRIMLTDTMSTRTQSVVVISPSMLLTTSVHHHSEM